MEKTGVMRRYSFFKALFLLTTLFLGSCFEDKYSFLYNTYKGSYPSSEKVNENGVVENIPAREIIVRVDRKSILINESRNKYSIKSDSDGFIIIETEAVNGDSSSVKEFRYLKDSGIMTMQDKNGIITLMTEYMIHMSKLRSFAHFTLTCDLKDLDSSDRAMIKKLFEVADVMDEIFWEQAYGNKEELMANTRDTVLVHLFSINYGPWERLNDNKPLLPVYGNKAPGANFYPSDMTKDEFEQWTDSLKTSQYSIVRRDRNNNLVSIPYHIAFKEQVTRAAELLREAADLSADSTFSDYLRKRAEAFETDNYYASDTTWMKMKDNKIDFIAGPIENYEDDLYNYKCAHEAYILIKDTEWSNRLKHITSFLPAIQKGLPVPGEYKTEIPSANSDINVYDAIYYRGDCNAGSKTIAINLPNDPEVRKNYGSRKLQLKNTIKAKFENILVPISNIMVAENQRQYIDFDAFFSNTLYHEIAHGLGVDYTVNGNGSVREALKENYSAIEECKADIMGLYIASKLSQMGQTVNDDLMTNYVTFMAGTFRSIRFGAANAHGKSNMIILNNFLAAGAFVRNNELATYSVDFNKMNQAITELMKEIISIQANGDYDGASALIRETGSLKKLPGEDLARLNSFQIPVDIVFDQGLDKLNL